MDGWIILFFQLLGDVTRQRSKYEVDSVFRSHFNEEQKNFKFCDYLLDTIYTIVENPSPFFDLLLYYYLQVWNALEQDDDGGFVFNNQAATDLLPTVLTGWGLGQPRLTRLLADHLSMYK